MTDCFVGLVSHVGSRFAESQGPQGLTARLGEELTSRGLVVTSRVNVDDAYRPELLAIDGAAVRRAVTAQIRLESRWSRYLREGDIRFGSVERWFRAATSAMLTGARLAKGWLRYYRPWHGADHHESRGARMVRRLLNIELSHALLMREGVVSGAPWILILEDDAYCSDPGQLATNLQGLMASRGAHPQPAYVNISQSFSSADLKVEYLLDPVSDVEWSGEPGRQVLKASRPISNTVCAILYRAEFLERFLANFNALPIDPVVPIDWKLNIVLMDMFHGGEVVAGDCWVVSPGPVDQQSMRPS